MVTGLPTDPGWSTPAALPGRLAAYWVSRGYRLLATVQTPDAEVDLLLADPELLVVRLYWVDPAHPFDGEPLRRFASDMAGKPGQRGIFVTLGAVSAGLAPPAGVEWWTENQLAGALGEKSPG